MGLGQVLGGIYSIYLSSVPRLYSGWSVLRINRYIFIVLEIELSDRHYSRVSLSREACLMTDTMSNLD